MNTIETVIPAANTVKVESPNFGTGRYSDLMNRLYKESQSLFGFSKVAAEKFARDAATTHGGIMATGKIESKVSKVSKDGKVSLSEASKVKGATSKPCLALMHTIQWIGEAGNHGVSFGNTKWQLSEFDENVIAYINDLD